MGQHCIDNVCIHVMARPGSKTHVCRPALILNSHDDSGGKLRSALQLLHDCLLVCLHWLTTAQRIAAVLIRSDESLLIMADWSYI